jgi:outer membrane protein
MLLKNFRSLIKFPFRNLVQRIFMKKTYVRTLAYIFLFLSIMQFNAFSQERAKVYVSLRDCIDRALVENLNFKSLTLGLKLDELTIKQQESAFNPTLGIQTTYERSISPNFTTYIPVSSIKNKRSNSNFTLGQKIFTGAEWGIGYRTTLSEGNTDIRRNYSSSASINITQPLLKGFGKKVTLSDVYVAKMTATMSALDLENQAASLVYNVQQGYWNLVYARNTLEVLKLSVSQAESLLAYNETAYTLGMKIETEVLEAKSAVINLKQQVISQENSIKRAEDILSNLLYFTKDRGPSFSIIPLDTLKIENIELDPKIFIESALQYRPDYLSTKKNIEKNSLQRDVAKNSLLPNLDLSTSYDLNGSGSTYQDNFDSMNSGKAYGWEVGLRLSYPIMNNNAKASYEKSKINIRRAELALDDLQQSIKYEIFESIRNVEFQQSQIKSMALSVEVNRQKLDQVLEQYRNNMSTSYMVLEYQKDLADAQELYQKSLVDYVLAMEKLKLDTGMLLKEYNISIIVQN